VRRLAAILVLPLLAFVTAGCQLLGVPGGGPASGGAYPDSCVDLGFSAVRCRAIVSRAANQAGIEPAQVASARFLVPEPEPGVMLGGGRVATVALTLADGTERVEHIFCTGISGDSNRVCRDDARIWIGGGVDRDVPCAGEAPAGCATPPPTPRPASVQAATALDVAALDVPLDHVGSYEILVGEASLPDGALSERRASLANTRPTTFWIDDGIRIEVRPNESGRPPIGSLYRDPYDGVEPVRVFLVFDVVETSPGAVLEVRDILVR
jgi:hypothetical protein